MAYFLLFIKHVTRVLEKLKPKDIDSFEDKMFIKLIANCSLEYTDKYYLFFYKDHRYLARYNFESGVLDFMLEELMFRSHKIKNVAKFVEDQFYKHFGIRPKLVLNYKQW
ncbi:MAG: hypothetical protein EKK64_08300 [Neisseriaceae bacterium]|nr:MAG: hypothetical protein EKK64_08300 [Neisseriaceae bacterium]